MMFNNSSSIMVGMKFKKNRERKTSESKNGQVIDMGDMDGQGKCGRLWCQSYKPMFLKLRF